MPEDPKKNLNKSKQDPKEQRKPRRHYQQSGEKKIDKKVEEPKSKVPATPPKPVHEEPGPEFYKNLKRETDEILKISEEATSKYKKKEIISNWAKYEMPIESYDETEEQDLGADYEKLVQTPMSIGGHFQFKHEKSWDVDTGPSPYDKYFELDMASLATALNAIPFYERNGIELSFFSDSDKLSMENRAVKYKRKYLNDKSYTTAEIEAQEKIESKLLEDLKNSEKDECNSNVDDISLEALSVSNNKKTEKTAPVSESATKENATSNAIESDIHVEQMKEFVPKEYVDQKEEYNALKEDNKAPTKEQYKAQKEEIETPKEEHKAQREENKTSKEDNKAPTKQEYKSQKENETPKEKYKVQKEEYKAFKEEYKTQKEAYRVVEQKFKSTADTDKNISPKIASLLSNNQILDISKSSNEVVTANSSSGAGASSVRGKESDVKPVIESPEDLEKWLDDFLDG